METSTISLTNNQLRNALNQACRETLGKYKIEMPRATDNQLREIVYIARDKLLVHALDMAINNHIDKIRIGAEILEAAKSDYSIAAKNHRLLALADSAEYRVLQAVGIATGAAAPSYQQVINVQHVNVLSNQAQSVLGRYIDDVIDIPGDDTQDA
jgi:hypothetical protein